MTRVLACFAFVSFALAACGDDASSSAPNADMATDSGPTNDAGASASLDGGVEASTPTDAGVGLDAAVSVASCGNRTGQRGLTHRTLTVGGVARTFLVYLPPTLDPKKRAPFVFVFHGYTMSGQAMHDITRYADLADAKGFGVAFPDGEGGPSSLVYPWNVKSSGQSVCGAGNGVSALGDDDAFVDAMKTDIAEDQCTDDAHLFAAGFSMGAYFTENLGCHRSDFRALAPHSGGALADLSACTTTHVPIILFHGTSDSVIDDACDDPSVKADKGFPAAASLWAAKNGCATTFTTVPNTGSGGGKGKCIVYDGCPADGQVELCTFEGMDHCWAGGAADAAGNACPSYADATALQWSFFESYAW